MYDGVYRGIEKSRSMIELKNEMWMNKEGLMVETEAEWQENEIISTYPAKLSNLC